MARRWYQRRHAYFWPSEQEPFTKVEFIEYLPSKIDFEHESKEDVDLYLSDVKNALIEADGIDPSILEVDWKLGHLKLIYTCHNLEDVWSVHQGYLEDSVAYIYKTYSNMGGTTECDGKPVEHTVPDISELDPDMQTIRDWTTTYQSISQAINDGSLAIDDSKAIYFMESS